MTLQTAYIIIGILYSAGFTMTFFGFIVGMAGKPINTFNKIGIILFSVLFPITSIYVTISLLSGLHGLKILKYKDEQ